MFKVSEHIKA